MQGMWKKVLRVDLSKRTTHIEEFPENLYINFIGGDGSIDALMHDYYELSGWNTKTGSPKREKLIELGISELAP